MQVYKDANGAIKGAEEKPSSSGKTYLYWATNTVLKRKELPGRTDWNDPTVVAENLKSCDWHTMKQVGGTLHIANGSWMAYVGYDDSYTNEGLDLIPGNNAKTIVERNGKSVIGTYKTSDPDKGINGAIDCEVPLVQIGDEGELYYSDMTSSIAIKKFPGGGKVNPGGVCNEMEQVNMFQWEETSLSWEDRQTFGNIALFAVYDADTGYGGVYSYGRKNKNHPLVMNLEYSLDADELGALANVNGTTIVSYQDGSTFGVMGVSATTKATGTYYGLDLKAPIKGSEGVKKPLDITNWKYAEVFMSPVTSGTSVQLWYKLDKTGDWVQANMEGEDTSFDSVGEKKAVFLLNDNAQIFEPKLILTPTSNTSPEVYRVRLYFE